MRSSIFLRAFALVACICCGYLMSLGQARSPKKQSPAEMPDARLTSAKTVMVVRARGNDIPYDVIKSTIEGWLRLTLVETADKADLIVEVATSGGNSETHVTASDGPSMLAGRPERSNNASNEVSNADITLTVYDSKNRRVLWTGKETAKTALKQTTRENNMVEAAERLASRFHDRLEPPPPPSPQN